MKRFCVQFMSGAFWQIESVAPVSIFKAPQALLATGPVKVTRLLDQLNGPPREIEAWVNPETIEAVWEAAE